VGGVRFPAINAARWARGTEPDAALAPLARHPDEALRRAAVEAYAWRVRKRKAPADPLLAALSHRDPTTQFLAAEGLARAGAARG
jgi:ParB family chromosome partitioning protein